MNIGLALFIIIAAIVVGYLYWDKIREVERLKKQLAWDDDDKEIIMGSVIWSEKDLDTMQQELDKIAQGLDEKGVELDRRIKHKWGWEYRFKNQEDIAKICPYYSIYSCNPKLGIRKIAASCVMLDKDLRCEQVLDILAINKEFIDAVHCYDGGFKVKSILLF